MKNINLLLNKNICLSGGADGADTVWGQEALNAGNMVIHWSFDGHKTKIKDNIYKLPKHILSEAVVPLNVANKTLKRKIPINNNYIYNLLKRNYMQVKYAESVYAVSSFNKNKIVSGGTAWAVQMYIDRFLVNNDPIEKCNLYMYDQVSNIWLTWKLGWSKVQSIPKPSGIWAGIGSRKITQASILEIKNLF